VGTHHGVFHDGKGSFILAEVTEANEHDIVVHDAHAEDPSLAFALSRMSHPVLLSNTPIGVFRDVKRDVYDRQMSEQIEEVTAKLGKGDLNKLLRSADTWEIA
jgi:2-oxoglutarate ferredoxin oxidoreductase subunit beta